MRQAMIALAAALGCGGCAHMEFSTADDGHGIPFYSPVPYVLVTTTADCGTTGTLLFMPDLSRPRYAIPHPGYGSNNLTLSFSNGMLTSFGQQTDTKVPETITALGSLATAALPRAVAPLPAGCAGKPPAQLYKLMGDGSLLLVPMRAR